MSAIKPTIYLIKLDIKNPAEIFKTGGLKKVDKVTKAVL